MSTHTDGAPPSVRAKPSAGPEPSAGPDASDAGTPPRPRRPETTPPANGTGSAVEDSGAAWVQQEIARRIAARGAGASGRHARPEGAGEDPGGAVPRAGSAATTRTAPGAAGTAPPDAGGTADPVTTGGPVTPDGSGGASGSAGVPAGPPAAGSVAAGSAAGPGDEEAPRPRAVPEPSGGFRRRSAWVPDPYAPDGLRGPEAGDEAGHAGTAPETPFRIAGPAAHPGRREPDPPAGEPAPATAGPEAPGAGPSGTDLPGTGSSATGSSGTGTSWAGTGAEPKQWPPANGAAGLPRRVPGAGWNIDRRMLLGEGTAVIGDADPDTRPVPSMWSAAATRSASTATPPSAAAPPVADPGARTAGPAEARDDDRRGLLRNGDLRDGDLREEGLREEDLPDDDDPRGSSTERTEVIWRAPGLDDAPAEPAGPFAAAPAPSVPPADPPTPHPYTGARPRRFAGAPTDAPVPESPEHPESREEAPEECPDGRRVRIVLSERRAIAHSVRTVVDVQDPGTVGTVLRESLVSNQLALALRVGGVALLSLGLLPALFAAFPAFGQVSVLGLRLPWLLLGFLVYPFLLGLGWWYVRSSERVEQDFVEDVQDR